MSSVLESVSLSVTEKMLNVSYPAEEMELEPEPDLGSQETPVKQNRTTHVPIPPQAGESCTICPTGLLSGLKPWARRWAVPSVILNLVLIITVIIFIIVTIALSAKKPEPCSADPTCPEGWVGYLGKCYYFSEAEGSWTYSQNNCSALSTSLAAIDTQQEMDFLMRYKGPSHHWIGLRREPGQPWVWTNGTKFNNWFPIAGGGLCAFVDNGEIVSSGCSREGHWICSKAAEKPAGRAK
ncbi:C-type lectin domain family 2 member D-like [Mauremys reevesii]|uniref:C-type lectin domain family 2 member D-like n=1 Tax=Mauremys reevesii TaxID=260615 RepID=UPI00193FEF7A|nr:C-type lectin domain family 2 member D-like [Mauremys reevesii]